MEGEFDPALEGVLDLIHRTGYAYAHQDCLSHKAYSESELLAAVDNARGGTFDEAPDSYPDSAHFTNADKKCGRSCNACKYFTWGLTSALGANDDRCEDITDEW